MAIKSFITFMFRRKNHAFPLVILCGTFENLFFVSLLYQAGRLRTYSLFVYYNRWAFENLFFVSLIYQTGRLRSYSLFVYYIMWTFENLLFVCLLYQVGRLRIYSLFVYLKIWADSAFFKKKLWDVIGNFAKNIYPCIKHVTCVNIN